MKKIYSPLLLILISALSLRLLLLNQSLWLDEGVSAITVGSMSIAEYFHNFLPGDFHPPLYYFIQKIFSVLFGDSATVLRLPALISGVFVVLMVYLISKEMVFKKKNQLRVAILTATSPLLVYYSAEARSYSTVAMAVLINFYLLISLKKIFNYKKLILFLVSGLVLVYLNYLAYFYLFIAFGLLLKTLIRKETFGKPKTLMLGMIFILLLLAILPILYQQLAIGTNISSSTPGWEKVIGSKNPIFNFLQFLIKSGSGRVDVNYSFITKILSAYAGILFMLLLFIKTIKKDFDWLFFVLVFSIMSILLVGLIYPIYSYFRLLFLVPILVLNISNLQLKKRLLTLIFFSILLVNIIFLSYLYLNPIFWKEDWKGASVYTNYLSAQHPDSMVIFSTSKPYDVYKYYNTVPAIGVGSSFVLSQDLNQDKKEEILDHQNIIYYDFLSDLSDPNKYTLNFLKSNYNEKTGYSFNKIGAVRLFIKK